MATDQIGGWVETPVEYQGVFLWPGHREGHAFGGLLVVPEYDLECGCSFPDGWEIWHQASGADVLVVRAPFERALEIAAHLAEIIDWRAMEKPNAKALQSQLLGFALAYPNEVLSVNQWLLETDDELEAIVPFGPDL